MRLCGLPPKMIDAMKRLAQVLKPYLETLPAAVPVC